MSIHNLYPCPFCGSKRLRIDTMYFDDDGEHDGVMVPKARWFAIEQTR